MVNIAFNVYTSTAKGVMNPMASSSRVDLKLSESPPASTSTFNHINKESDETYVVLSGDYSIRVGQKDSPKSKVLTAQKGDVFTIPRTMPHGDVFTQKGYRVLLLEAPPRNKVDEWTRKFEKAVQGWIAPLVNG